MVLSQTVLTLEFASEPLKNGRNLGLGGDKISGSDENFHGSVSVHADSGSQEIFACEIQNPGLESGIQLKESAIPLTIAIRHPSSTKKKSASNTWNPEPNFVLEYLTLGE